MARASLEASPKSTAGTAPVAPRAERKDPPSATAAPPPWCTCGLPFCTCLPPAGYKDGGGNSDSDEDTASKKKRAPASAPPAAKVAAPAGPRAAPSFLLGGGSKASYAASGEGLRDAVKAGDTRAVTDILRTAPGLAVYADRQGQTILHLVS
jgi:hypothetical protein